MGLLFCVGYGIFFLLTFTTHKGVNIMTLQILHICLVVCKYMVMSRDQNAGRIHSVRMDNSTFERVEVFKYLGTTLTNQNAIQEEIKSRLRSGNACYCSVQNLLSSRLLSKKFKDQDI